MFVKGILHRTYKKFSIFIRDKVYQQLSEWTLDLRLKWTTFLLPDKNFLYYFHSTLLKSPKLDHLAVSDVLRYLLNDSEQFTVAFYGNSTKF